MFIDFMNGMFHALLFALSLLYYKEWGCVCRSGYWRGFLLLHYKRLVSLGLALKVPADHSDFWLHTFYLLLVRWFNMLEVFQQCRFLKLETARDCNNNILKKNSFKNAWQYSKFSIITPSKISRYTVPHLCVDGKAI